MKRLINTIRRFYTSMGLVEQSQVVASTAVVVAMLTIVSAHFGVKQSFEWLDFISIVTVGVIGFVSVFFTVKYGRQLEEQRRELLALNAIAESVNHSVELNYVLRSSLIKVMELMRADYGWIYISEQQRLVLKHQMGSTVKFFPSMTPASAEVLYWIREPGVHSMTDSNVAASISEECTHMGIAMVASIPLERQGIFAGMLIIASKESEKLEAKKITLLEAFGNQISVALQNASLFEQVKQSERLYVDLYEQSPDMYHSVDRNGIVVSCNLTESRTLGMAKEQIVGRPLLRLYPESQHESVKLHLKSIFELGKELKEIEEQIQKQDGGIIDVSVNTSIVYNQEGKAMLVRMVLRDITDKKKMEAKILQVQKIDSIGNLAGGIAHNFNNILTTVLASASIMRRKIGSEQRFLKYVDLIETASRSGASVTRQLLTFARKSNPHVKLVDMNSALEATVRLFEATTSKTIQIQCELSPEPVIVQADEGQLQQAILNLCLNARDAMPNGGALVLCCTQVSIDEQQAQQITEGKPGEYVVISVADSGSGIPKEILNHIFEPFFTTKDASKGSGLGLSVVYGVIRAHNGYIYVESEGGHGTTFTIYLPRIMNGSIVEHKKSKEIIGGNEHVLWIEDEASVAEVGFDILKDLGYSVELASDGKEAIDKLTHGAARFDLVLLDMNMPNMDGGTVLKFIKQQFPQMKVLICSGYSSTMFEDETLMKSVNGFIPKPYEIEDLAEKLREVLDNSLH